MIVHADDTDCDNNNDCDDKEYDGSINDYDLVLQEIGSSSEDEEYDNDDEQEVNDGVEDEFFSSMIGTTSYISISNIFFWRCQCSLCSCPHYTNFDSGWVTRFFCATPWVDRLNFVK